MPEDPDCAIYSKFFTDYDKALFKMVRQAPPEQRIGLHFKFMDNRCPQMLWRHVCRNYPEVLDEENLQQWKSFASTRLLCPPGNPINDIYFVERKIVEKLESTTLTERERDTLVQLQEYMVALKRYVGLK